MRPRFQQGQILHKGANWVLRYHEDRVVNGITKRVRTNAFLAPFAEYPWEPTKQNLATLRSEFNDKINSVLVPVNRGAPSSSASGAANLDEFIEHSYFPRLKWRSSVPAGNELHIELSTINCYNDIFNVHVKDNPVAKIRMRDFTPRDGQRFLESIDQELSHQTHLRIKNFVRGVFTWAIADGAFQKANPMTTAKAGGWTKASHAPSLADLPEGERIRKQKIRASNNHAYSLEEVAEMLDKLPEPGRTVCAVAAFTGLARSELRGLKWDDYDGQFINVQRKIWNQHIGAPKTQAREEGIFIVPVLRKIIAKYKREYPPASNGWMFRGERLLRPLDLDNLSRREIPKYINGAWFGWHAFRRGLGTRLYEAGVKDKDIQAILRHADVSTTMAYYICPDKTRAEKGLRKFSKMAQSKYGIKA